MLAGLDRMRDDLRFYVHEPRRWLGMFRRATFARAVQGSNSIEGDNASVEDVVAVIEDESRSRPTTRRGTRSPGTAMR